MNLSYSSLSDMKSCGRCFYFDRKFNIKRPQGIKSGMPTAVDGILKESLEVFRGGLPPALKSYQELNGFELYEGADLKKMRHWNSNPMNIDLGNGNRVIGALDDLLHNRATETFAYLDYKTTSKEPGPDFGAMYYQSQCDIYSAMLERWGKKVAEFGVLLFFWPVQGADGAVAFKSKAVFLKPNTSAAFETFGKAIALLDKTEVPEADPGCEWCDWIDKRSKV